MEEGGMTDPVFDRARISAELTKGFQVISVIEKPDQEKGYGPWALVVDEGPKVGGAGTGPSPVHVALAGLASCTVVTLAGVARRRKMDLRGIRVEIEAAQMFSSKAAAEEAAASGEGAPRRKATKRIILTGVLDEAEVAILERAAHHCPVSRMMEGGILAFEQLMEVSEGPGSA